MNKNVEDIILSLGFEKADDVTQKDKVAGIEKIIGKSYILNNTISNNSQHFCWELKS